MYWRKQDLEPEFTLTQLTELMEEVGYQTVCFKKGIVQRERIRIIDDGMPLTLDNIEILVNAGDELRISVSG